MPTNQVEVTTTQFGLIVEAYLAMAKNGHRPAAPTANDGGIALSCDEMKDPGILYAEACKYAEQYIRNALEEDFTLGMYYHGSARARIFIIEAWRLTNALDDREIARKASRLCQMAIEELK